MSITPVASPVPPILASTLLATSLAVGEGQGRPLLRTGYADVDEGAFAGGLEYGTHGLVGIACGDANVAVEFVSAALTTHLLATTSPDVLHNPTLHVATTPLHKHGIHSAASPSAYYIDALAHPTFSPARLHAQLTAQHRRDRATPRFMHTGYMYAAAPAAISYAENTAQQADQALEARVDEAMERVALLRVFDFAGLLEAVREVDLAIAEMAGQSIGGDARKMGKVESAAVGDKLERSGEAERGLKKRRLSASPAFGTRARMDGDKAAPVAGATKLPAWRHRGEVLDSQASVDADTGNRTPIAIDAASGTATLLLHQDIDVDADMLDAPSTPAASVPTKSLSPVRAPTNRLPAPQHPPLPVSMLTADEPFCDRQGHASEQSQSPILLIIAALPRLLAPLMREDHVRGHALLTHLGRRLAHLAHRAPVCAMLLNTTVGGSRAGDDIPVHGGANVNVNANSVLGTLESAFGDVSERPALGRTWPFFADVGVMLSRRGNEGARREGGAHRDREWIAEVLADRDGHRVGRWGMFEVQA